MENICSKCNAGCCRKYSVCLNGYDIARLAGIARDFSWIDAIYADDTSPEIARSFSLYVDGERKEFIPVLAMTGEGNCIFLGTDNLCKVYGHRPMICRIYPFNQRTGDKLEYKENFRCPVKWKLLGKDAEEFLKNIKRNKRELEEYGKWCDEWNASLTTGKTFSGFLEFVLEKADRNKI